VELLNTEEAETRRRIDDCQQREEELKLMRAKLA
jgi:hypothetical protein